MKKSTFFIPNTKEIFNRLKQASIKALIFQYFDLKSYIRIKTDVLAYAISNLFSLLSSNYRVPDGSNLTKPDFG